MHGPPPLLAPERRVLPTLNDDGTRRWITPKHARGRFNTLRTVVGWVLIGVFVAIPFLRMNGRPLVWLDLPTRHFTLFGTVFLPTDTEVLLLGMLAIFLGIFFLSAVLGRVWCGYGCPQTVYMELVYRPVERFFSRLSKGYEKTWRRPAGLVGKHLVFLLISMGLAHTFLAYFVSVDALAQWVRMSPFEHPAPFIVMAVTTALVMVDFSFFREQMCTVVCPYARLQAVLLDKHSLIIGYDQKRGEPRGKAAVGEIKRRLPLVERSFGDCIDCNACVSVCPTGIDIRDGLQLECIACAQCVDACDAIMTKVGAPQGLIRYSSQATLEDGEKPKLLRVRTMIYPALLVILVGLLVFVLTGRESAEAKVLRGVGAPFTEQADGTITNQIRVRIANRSSETTAYSLRVAGPEGVVMVAPVNPVTVAPDGTESAPAFVQAPRGIFSQGDVEVRIVVEAPDGWSAELPFKLLGPGGLR
jgi:cytochrome c oxidase accessory protein FixG